MKTAAGVAAPDDIGFAPLGGSSMSAEPRVSVVMATYNRSNIIGYAIRSLLQSKVRDWELIVVGDACTDDTEAVVAAFADPRIRFLGLSHNFGEQSGPNNAGVDAARGGFIAFLNHDDLWLPDHLERSLAILEGDPSCDLVFGLGLMIPQDDRRPPMLVGATTARASYHSGLSVPASLWVMRAQLARRIGPWRSAWTVRTAASQDWLIRAYRAGAVLRPSPHIAGLIVSSRKDSYSSRAADLHARLYSFAAEPARALDLLTQAALAWEAPRWDGRPGQFLAEGLRAAGRRALALLGVCPAAPGVWLRWPGKGQLIRELRRLRGLPDYMRVG
jgi:glycosyltransferase involved in cell wall biosynthesis